MRIESLGYASILLLGIFISSLSQVLLKKASMKEYSNRIYEYLNPYVIVAYILLLGTTLLSIIAYKGISLSLGLVLETTSYIYVTFFAVKIFKEKINIQKILSICTIIIGIIIFTLFG